MVAGSALGTITSDPDRLAANLLKVGASTENCHGLCVSVDVIWGASGFVNVSHHPGPRKPAMLAAAKSRQTTNSCHTFPPKRSADFCDTPFPVFASGLFSSSSPPQNVNLRRPLHPPDPHLPFVPSHLPRSQQHPLPPPLSPHGALPPQIRRRRRDARLLRGDHPRILRDGCEHLV